MDFKNDIIVHKTKKILLFGDDNLNILHTSDWHLGKHLEGFSRLDEQEEFIDFLVESCDEEEVDVIIVSGDIFDTSNPPSKAESLYYRALKRLSRDGQRLIVIISGNHDNPERLGASSPLARELGILICNLPSNIKKVDKIGNFQVLSTSETHMEILIKGEKLRLGLLPYPSESRLSDSFEYDYDEGCAQEEYTKRVGRIFEMMDENFDDDGYNIAISHIFVMGGSSSESERPIQLGGGLLVNPKDLPKKADYIALGHLHKPQKVKVERGICRYSGSPIEYSRSEAKHSKLMYLIDTKKKGELKEIKIPNFKPIEVWKAKSIGEAIEMCRENTDKKSYVYLEIETDRIIDVTEIKAMKSLKSDIISILPVFTESEKTLDSRSVEEKSISELFKEFFIHVNQTDPDDNIMKVFNEIVYEEGEDYETN